MSVLERRPGGFVLGDLTTNKGDGITWIEKDGAHHEDLSWQLSESIAKELANAQRRSGTR
jgi:hypothetical protein